MLQKTAPVTADKLKERREKISKVDMRTFREIMTDADFKTDSRIPLKKPVFFFGDNIGEDDDILMTAITSGFAR